MSRYRFSQAGQATYPVTILCRVPSVAAWAMVRGDEAVYWPHATDAKEV